MKSHVLVFISLILIFGFQVLTAQDFAGQYSAQTEEGNVTLSLQSSGSGYSGTLSEGGFSYHISGTMQDGMLTGAVGDEWDGIIFQGEIEGTMLNFTIVETDEYGDLSIFGTDSTGVFGVNENLKNVNMSNLEISHGNGGFGGGIYCMCSNLTLNHVSINHNSAIADGGGIFWAAEIGCGG